MIIRNCSMSSFSKRSNGREVVCYGIGGEFERIIRSYFQYDWISSINMLVDSNEKNENKEIIINEKKYYISSLENLIKYANPNMIILITSKAYYEIVRLLNGFSALNNIECYIFHFMFPLSEGIDYSIRRAKEALIPPVIHYCWFGRKDMPDAYKRCIESWHYHCPDYEIREWNEDNCDIEETTYTSQAYNVGKYGFVPDYFRLKIIYENGGIYLDTDVEVLKNLDDLRYNQAFCGLEFPGEAALGLGFGAIRKNKSIKKLMNRYNEMRFIYENGEYNEIGSPVYQSEDLIKMGMNYQNKIQTVEEMTIYPIEVLSPQNVYTSVTQISSKTYMWHHYDGSWLSQNTKERKQIRISKAKEIYRLIIDEDRNGLIYE